MFLEKEAIQFLEKIFVDIAASGLRLEPHWDVDHLCYRVESLSRYQEMKAKLESESTLLVESEVNGRMIATFQLPQPILFRNYEISVIELPAPKPGKIVAEGFEHIEVVCDASFEFMMNEHPDLKPDRSGLKKLFNKELEFNFSAGAVKFHHLSLASVVELEKNTRVWSAVQASQILEVLKMYEPEVAGTYPLGIAVEHSDVDILVGAGDLHYLQSVLEDAYRTKADLKVVRQKVDGKESLVTRFSQDGVLFEVFAQNRPAIQQAAYQHFLVEEKLLKFGGEKLKEKVRSFKKEGLKTEPAFAKALNLSGDAYQALLQMQKQPLGDLAALVERR